MHFLCQDSNVFPACLILFGQFKFQAPQPFARLCSEASRQNLLFCPFSRFRSRPSHPQPTQWYVGLVWTENILETELFENDDVTITILYSCQSYPKWLLRFQISPALRRRKTVWCVLGPEWKHHFQGYFPRNTVNRCQSCEFALGNCNRAFRNVCDTILFNKTF